VYLTNGAPDFLYSPRACGVNPSRCNRAINAPKLNTNYSHIFEEILSENPSLKFIDTYKHLCNTDECSMWMDKKIMYIDENHLGVMGSKDLAEKVLYENPSLKK